MKNILLTAFLAGISTQVEAQQLSIGYKTGVNNWIRINTTHTAPIINEVKDGASVSWHNEIFLCYQTKGKLALEGGISHTKRERDGVSYIIDCWGGRDSRVEDINISYTSLNLGLQYKLKTPVFINCPALNRFSNNIGVNFSPILVNNATEHRFTSHDVDSTMQQGSSRQSSRYIALSTGITHTLMYQVNKRINVLSKVGIDYIFTGRENYNANIRIGPNLGVSYNIR